MDTVYSYGNERLTNERFTGWTGYYTYDPRGSVSGVTDSEGMIWQSYRYDVFGNITFGKPQYNNVYSYNAESYNPNVDVQYLRARYYCPTTADFLTEDSYLGNIIDPLTLNRYSYVKSSPLNYVDPSGHSAAATVGSLIVLAGLVLGGCSNSEDVIETIEAESSVAEIQIKIETQAPVQESMTSAKDFGVATQCSEFEVEITKQLMEEMHWEPLSDTQLDELISVLDKYEITTINRMAHFFGQTRYETFGGYWMMEVNWLKEGVTDPSKWIDDEEYFNKKYGPSTSRGENLGNTKEGDGYLFRGAGAIQLTGRYNYQKFADAMQDPMIMEKGADYVAENYFWEAGGYFWNMKGINEVIDSGGTSDDVSKIVNRYDTDSFGERKEKYNEAYKTLCKWKK